MIFGKRQSYCQRLLLYFVMTLLHVACATTSTKLGRELVIENEWVRNTSSDKWAEDVRRTNYSQAIISGEIVYQANARDALVAYNRKTGNEVWRLTVKNGVTGGIALAAGSLFFGASDGQIYGVNAANGRIIWTFPTRSETLAAPLVQDETVYILAGNNTLYALKADTGKQLWIYTRNVSSGLSIRGGTQPAKSGDHIFAGFTDGFFVAVSAKDGALVWERQLSTNQRFRDVKGSPVIENGRIYVSTYDGALFALSLQDGQVIWRHDEGGQSAITILGDKIFYSTSSGKVQCLDKSSGRETWTYSVKGGVASQSSIYQNLLVFTESMGGLTVLDLLTGKHLKTYSTGRGLYVRPTIDTATGQLYVISNEANLYALKMAWRRPERSLPWQ